MLLPTKEKYDTPVRFLQDPERWSKDRQRIILGMLTTNFSYKQIAKAAGVYPSTVSQWADKYMGEINAFRLTDEEYDQLSAYVGIPSGRKSVVRRELDAILKSEVTRYHVLGMRALGFSDKQISDALGISAAVLRDYLPSKPLYEHACHISVYELLKLIRTVGLPENNHAEYK